MRPSERTHEHRDARNLWKGFQMPSSLDVRRQREFRPLRYSYRHKLVAVLRAISKTRPEISALTGYSRWHVSRVAGMQSAQRDSAQADAAFERALIDEVMKRYVPASARTRKGDS